MAKTNFGLGLWTPQESWRSIRTIRSSPPPNLAPILQGDRKRVFHMALEQAQDLYEAASKVGYASRPLLLFYGLSQAGRAIAAASSNLGLPMHRRTPSEVVNGVSHGLEFDTTVPTHSSIWTSTIKVVPTNRDSFSRACVALNSPTDLGQVALGAVVSQFIDFQYEFRDFAGWPRAFSTSLSLHRYGGGDATLELTDFSGPPNNESVQRYLKPFAPLAQCKVRTSEDGEVALSSNGYPTLQIPSALVHVEDGVFVRLAAANRYLGTEVLLPNLGSAPRATHPLLSWWMLLFSSSMLARYAPKDWAGVLDLANSTDASQIEFVADAALSTVPMLLAEALETLNK